MCTSHSVVAGAVTVALAQKYSVVQASDVHKDLIYMWRSLQEGWTPPTEVSEELYQQTKGRSQEMKNKKPCEECGHTKSKHRKNSCNQVWQVRGQTFMGISRVTKGCTCTGYKQQEGVG